MAAAHGRSRSASRQLAAGRSASLDIIAIMGGRRQGTERADMCRGLHLCTRYAHGGARTHREGGTFVPRFAMLYSTPKVDPDV